MLKTPKEKLIHKLCLNGTTIEDPVKINIDDPISKKITPPNPSTTIQIQKITSNTDSSKHFKSILTYYEEHMAKTISKAFDKYLTQLAEELNVSKKCAEYYAMKYFNFQIEVTNDKKPTLILIPSWKTPGQILSDLDKIKDVECEKEILYRNIKEERNINGTF